MTFVTRFLVGSRGGSFPVAGVALALMLAMAAPALAGKSRGRRGPSPQQIQKMKEEMAYRQQEVARFQRETAAVQQSLFKQFDENGDGRLLGAERSKYDKFMYEIQSGKAPSPFASIKPLGQGPGTTTAGK